MKIAQVAPLWERVPLPVNGGIELVVGLLIDELVTRTNEVTRFVSGDAIISARLRSTHHQALPLEATIEEPSIDEMLQAAGRIDPVDVEYFDRQIEPRIDG